MNESDGPKENSALEKSLSVLEKVFKRLRNHNESNVDNHLSSIDFVNRQLRKELLNHHDTELNAVSSLFSP